MVRTGVDETANERGDAAGQRHDRLAVTARRDVLEIKRCMTRSLTLV